MEEKSLCLQNGPLRPPEAGRAERRQDWIADGRRLSAYPLLPVHRYEQQEAGSVVS